MYAVELTERAGKELSKLPTDIQDRIIAALERIRVRPYAFVRKLVGDPGHRLRIGDYRIIMDIGRDRILVLKIGHRRNIYA